MEKKGQKNSTGKVQQKNLSVYPMMFETDDILFVVLQ
jgi:hypothetical protein